MFNLSLSGLHICLQDMRGRDDWTKRPLEFVPDSLSCVVLSPLPRHADCGLDDSAPIASPVPLLRLLHNFGRASMHFGNGAHFEGLLPVGADGKPSLELCQAVAAGDLTRFAFKTVRA